MSGWMSLLNLAFLGCISLSLATACHPNDSSALHEFAGQLVNGSVKFAWSSELDCCEWEGVVCDDVGNTSAAGRVSMLKLSGKGLKGKLSESLSRLDHLKFLDLSHNSLEGGLPSNLSFLKSIQSLNLSVNSFTGNLDDLGMFPNLVALNISNNFFSGELNCSFSNSIRVLDFSSNRFTGGLRSLYNCAASLELLHLDFNSLSGHLPEELYSLSSLELLSISANSFSGQISNKISGLSNIRAIVLSGNQFSGPFPNVFWNLTLLERFVAHSNSFSGPIPSTLSLCSELQVLDLRNNSFSGSVDLDFSGLRSLLSLDFGGNHLYGPLPESLSTCQELKIVSLARNKFAGKIPESYANLSSLAFLSLSNNSLVNISASLSVLQHCKNLTALILTKNFHGEEVPPSLKGFKSLLLLALGNCGLTGRIPNWLLNCPKLQVLDLSWNHLEGTIPSWIGQMDGLFYLDFSNNSLTGEIPKGMMELKGLISATLSSSGLNASTGIPLFVKRNQSAPGLQYNQASSFPPSILLSNNLLNGSILPEIGQLRRLLVLDVSRNNITGTIPSSISNMENLETLDLSYNDLLGSIPSSFNRLTFLSMFSVAYNHLEGAIPTGGQFLSFPTSSFEGNPGLCGNLISPCAVGLHPPTPSRANGKLGRGRILGLTISIGIGIAAILAILLLRNARKDTENAETAYSDASAPPKLVLFKNTDLTVSNLLKSTNNFSQSNIIGCGGFGLVYKADLPNGTKAAVKRLSGDCGQVEREFQAEVEALSRAQHKNLVHLQGYCLYSTDQRLLIYSYMENGSLDYWLHENVDIVNSSLTWTTRLRIAQGAARGLAYLHKEHNIIHRDIKSSNILLDEGFEAHLADFGLSRLLRPYDTHVTTDLVGTLGYIPPEYSQAVTATFRGDVYSFGIVLLELLTGRRPVEVCIGKKCRDLVAWVYKKRSDRMDKDVFDSSIRDQNCEKQLMEVLGIACVCIDKDPRKRPSIHQVVSLLDAVG